jgi:hypothetical protein
MGGKREPEEKSSHSEFGGRSAEDLADRSQIVRSKSTLGKIQNKPHNTMSPPMLKSKPKPNNKNSKNADQLEQERGTRNGGAMSDDVTTDVTIVASIVSRIAASIV